MGELPAEAAAANPRIAQSHADVQRRGGIAGTPRLESTLPTEDPEFLEIVQEFADRLHEQLGEMQKAWEQKELAELASLAHWLKGSGGTAGFNAFTRSGGQAGKIGQGKASEEIAAALADVQDLEARRASRRP